MIMVVAAILARVYLFCSLHVLIDSTKDECVWPSASLKKEAAYKLKNLATTTTTNTTQRQRGVHNNNINKKRFCVTARGDDANGAVASASHVGEP